MPPESSRPAVPLRDALDPEAASFYRRACQLLGDARVPALVGGAYAFATYTGIICHTKDFDIFLRREDCARALDVLSAGGYRTELSFPHWLAKAFSHDLFIDLIFSGGNGVAVVDDRWFAHAVDGEVLGIRTRVCPAEEMIWSKGFIMERERYDGADVVHLLRARGRQLDWKRLLDRFGPHWRVLLAHLVLFGFVYPDDRSAVPDGIVRELLGRLDREGPRAPPDGPVCQGTLLSREQYLADVQQWGYEDARLAPRGNMTREEIARWTEAIDYLIR